MLERAHALTDQLVAWRRDIHMHPELGFEEQRTARLVADNLNAMGVEVQTGVGVTGVVGYLGDGGPVIGIRADMDALPIQEKNDVPYASRTPGVMHACGHDAHTAILLGAAKLLSEMPQRPPGQVRFLFQPSEEKSDAENKSGAVRMIEDGALEGVDAVIALHVDGTRTVNQVTVEHGYASANEDAFSIHLTGTGGHGAFPHYGSDPIFILAQVINAIHGIRARRLDPTKAGAVSIGSVHAGEASNVIPNLVKITGTMRSFDDETRAQLKRELEEVLGVARALGGDFSLRFKPGYPSSYHDPAVCSLIEASAKEMLGAAALVPAQPGMGAEDFSYMLRKAPGAMFMLGAKRDETDRGHHTPIFDIDESALPTGAALLADMACRLLREHGS